jgi:hypothetical protein
MFILREDWRQEDDDLEFEALLKAHANYDVYLKDNRVLFPESAYEFATAEWHHNFSDHRAPHDSWVTSITIKQVSIPSTDSGGFDAELVLFGAYHDGHLHIKYKSIHSFTVHRPEVAGGPIEVYRDEVRLSENNLVLHEIEFLALPNWLVECEDISVTWEPLVEHLNVSI